MPRRPLRQEKSWTHEAALLPYIAWIPFYTLIVKKRHRISDQLADLHA